MLTYQQEDLPARFSELEPLLERHWREVGRDHEAVPLDIDLARYTQLTASGSLVFLTARDNGKMVGYLTAIVSTHLHYGSTLFASIDAFWLDPQHRKGLNGVRLFVVLERVLAKRGVRKMMGQTKLGEGLDVSELYQALGWTATETLFTKVV